MGISLPADRWLLVASSKTRYRNLNCYHCPERRRWFHSYQYLLPHLDWYQGHDCPATFMEGLTSGIRATLTMLLRTWASTSSSVPTPISVVCFSPGLVCKIGWCLLEKFAVLQVFLWGQNLEIFWLERRPKYRLLDARNWIISSYGFHRNGRQSSKAWLLLQ